MRGKAWMAGLVLASAMSLVMPPAGAAVNAEVAGPGAWLAGYAQTTIRVRATEPLMFANLDPTASHNLVSVSFDGNGRHLFSTPLIGAGRTADVSGVAALAPGRYEFFCVPHSSSMTGILIVE